MTNEERKIAAKGLERAERRLAEHRENLARIDALRASLLPQIQDAEELVAMIREVANGE